MIEIFIFFWDYLTPPTSLDDVKAMNHDARLTNRTVRSPGRLEKLPEVAVPAGDLVHCDIHGAPAAVHHHIPAP